MLGRGSCCPKVIAATHFHEVFQEDMLDPDELHVTFVHMQVMLTSSRGELMNSTSVESDTERDYDAPGRLAVRPGERITYLYR